MADKHELPYSFISDGESIDYILHGKTNSLKEQFYDTSHPQYTLNITTGALASDNNAAVTPYYEIPNSTGFFAVRFDASNVSSWDYINLCVYEYNNSTYTFWGHVYPIKTITSESGYITKIFYCKYASASNKIVCRFVVPVGIINDSTKFDIYTGVGEVLKAQWSTGQRDNGQGGTFGYCRITAKLPTEGGNYTLAFKSYRNLFYYLYYNHIDEQGNITRLQPDPVAVRDNPANLTLPSGCNYITSVMEDSGTWNYAISAGEVDDVRVWKTNNIEFDIPVTVSDLAPITVRTNNLFDYETMGVSVENYYLNEDGSTSQSNNWNISDYVPCNGTVFTICNVAGAYASICLYDDNKQYIAGKKYNLDGKPRTAVTITSQSTAKFIRFSYYKNKSNQLGYTDIKYIQLIEGSDIPIPFEPYGYKTVIPDNANTMDCQISLDLPLRTGDKLVYADQKRIDSDNTETEIELPEITPYIGINTLSANTNIIPSLEIVGEEEDDKKRPSGDIATVHKVIEYFNVYNTEYVSLLNSKNIEYLIRIELLNNYETTLGEITRALSAETQGQINVNYNQITRRSCSLSVANVEQKYVPSESNPFWVNRKFRLWIGVYQHNTQSEDKIYWWSQGVFVCKDANADAHTVNITGVDKGGLLDGTLKVNMSEKQYKFFVGENVPLVIRDILMFNMGLNVIDENNKYGGGQPIDPIPPLVDTKYRFTRLEQDVYVDINNYLSQMIESIADGIGADAYYDTNGRFQVVPTPDATRLDGYKYVASQWDFTDLSAFYSNVNYQYNFDGINYVNVYTNSSTKENVSYTAINDNPLSPLQIRTVGLKKAENREIDYFETVNGDMITKDAMKEYCRQSARAQLYRESMIGMSLSFNAPIIPHMDVGRTISVSDKYQDIEDGIFVVQSITFPLSGDAMQINATNINWLPLDKDMEGVDI